LLQLQVVAGGESHKAARRVCNESQQLFELERELGVDFQRTGSQEEIPG
jgi:hypothetical protein